MSTILDEEQKRNLVERIRKKVLATKLKTEEVQAINKARGQVFTHATVGGVLGASGTFYLATRKRRMAPIFLFPLVIGGSLVGTQMGMMSGVMSGIRTIKKLPDQTRLFNLIKEIQQEVMEANGYTRDDRNDMMSRPRPMTIEERQAYQQRLLNENVEQGYQIDSSHHFDQDQPQETNDQDLYSFSDSEIVWSDTGNSTTSWDKIRQQNTNNSDNDVWK